MTAVIARDTTGERPRRRPAPAPTRPTWESAFAPVADTFFAQVGRFGGGAALCVQVDGESVLDIWAGDAAHEEPWLATTCTPCFSTTKAVAATAVNMLVDRGVIGWDTPVVDIWPEYAPRGGSKARTTVRHVLTHTAGMHRLRRHVASARDMLDWERMVSVMEESEPAYVPGTASAYHAITFGWLAGEIVRRADGRPVEQFVEDEVVVPLGLDRFSFGAPLGSLEREDCAPLDHPGYAPLRERRLRPLGELGGQLLSALHLPLDTRRMVDALVPKGFLELIRTDEFLDAPMPAANGVFSARALAGFYSGLAGFGNGPALVSRRTFGAISLVQHRRRDLLMMLPMGWRLGYHMVVTTRGIPGTAFGHFGYGGSGGFCDTARRLSVGYVTNRVGLGQENVRLPVLAGQVLDVLNRSRR